MKKIWLISVREYLENVRTKAFIIGIVLTFGFLGFLVNNFDTRVPVTVLSTPHEGVPLWLVVVVAMLVMLVLVGIAAIAEGAKGCR